MAAGWDDPDGLQVVEGPDEYLFGEETGLLEVIEGNLPLPRWLPPFQQGLFATTDPPHPTVVNNVETVANVPLILQHGAAAFRQMGTSESPGTMLFTVTGDVADAGVYELPLGTPLRQLLVDIAGAGDIKAVFSGVSSPVIGPDRLDTPLTYEDMRTAGTSLGSGGFVVYDHSHCMVRVACTCRTSSPSSPAPSAPPASWGAPPSPTGCRRSSPGTAPITTSRTSATASRRSPTRHGAPSHRANSC